MRKTILLVFMRKLTIIIKPTNLCNLSCGYCIVPEKVLRKQMSILTFEELCNKLSYSKIYDYFIWHGGEPMLMGTSFYEEVLAVQTKTLFGQFRNTFQSNCSLIDDKWMAFLKKYGIKVSTSIDGPEELHNTNRLIGKRGSFSIVYNNVKQLQKENLFSGAVTVLSKNNIFDIDKIIDFFASEKINTRLNPLLPCDRVGLQSNLCINPELYANALIHCFDKWIDGCYQGGEHITIAPLTDIVFNITHESNPRLCIFSESCSDSFLGINPNGDLFNCGRFSDVEAFKIANITEIECVDDVIEKKHKLIDWHLDEAQDNCRNCNWLKICNRGCPNVSYLYYGRVLDKDPYCEAYKKVFSHIYDRLRVELE